MTVSALNTRNDITATSGQATFTYTFMVLAATDMTVYQNGALLASGYTVTGVGSTTGGTVVLDTGALTGQIVSLVLAMPLDRTTNYQNSGDFLAGDVNGDFDKIYIGAIQNENEGGRSLRLQDVEPPTAGVDMTIPLKADRLGKFLAFDSVTGGPIAGSGAAFFDSAAWSVYDFTGDGTTVAFTLGSDPATENNTQVYIDGVYQQKDGYSVTGAVLTFSVAPPNLSTIEVMVVAILPIGSTSSDLVSYTPAGTGAVATTVQTKLRESVSVQDFGAVGDGTTDDTAAIILALNSGFKNITGNGLTYKVTSALTISASDITLQDMVLDTSATSGEISFITASGTQGSNVALTADSLTGSNTVTVGDTSTFVVDGYAYISSDEVWSATQTVLLGQIVKIKSKTSTVLTLHDDVLYDFNTADSAVVAPITTLNNITLKNVTFIGANDLSNNQTAVKFNKCFNVNVENCSFDYYSYASAVFDRCIHSGVNNSSTRFARLSGLAYGFAILNGCYSVSVSDCFSQDQRHMVTVGDNEGINLYIRITGNHAASAADAGIDAHPACDFMVIDGNTVEAIGVAVDGIIFQGQNCIISNNIVVGNLTQGIRVQALTEIGTASAVITGNSIANIGSAGTNKGILIDQDTTGSVNSSGVIVSNNKISGSYEYGIYIVANDNEINDLVVSGNAIVDAATTAGIYVRSDTGASVSNLSITGNVVSSSGTQGIYLFAEGSTGDIAKGNITGNTIGPADFGIRLIKTSDIVISGNQNQGTSRKVHTTTTTGTVIDQSASPVITMTGSTYTVLQDAEYLIANLAGTITVTLPLASEFGGRVLNIKTIQAQTVVSASSDVVPIGDTAAGTAILPATDGAWVLIKSDGTNWIVMQSS